MLKKFIYLLPLLSSLFLLLGCAKEHIIYKKPPANAPSTDAAIKLAEAAAAISNSVLEIAKVEKTITPPSQDHLLTIPNSYNLQMRASVDWSGPIAEVTKTIANAAHYRLRVMGKEPAIPVLVSVNALDVSLAEILRNLDYQVGNKADIHVYPKNQVIELRYAKIYS